MFNFKVINKLENSKFPKINNIFIFKFPEGNFLAVVIFELKKTTKTYI